MIYITNQISCSDRLSLVHTICAQCVYFSLFPLICRLYRVCQKAECTYDCYITLRTYAVNNVRTSFGCNCQVYLFTITAIHGWVLCTVWKGGLSIPLGQVRLPLWNARTTRSIRYMTGSALRIPSWRVSISPLWTGIYRCPRMRVTRGTVPWSAYRCPVILCTCPPYGTIPPLTSVSLLFIPIPTPPTAPTPVLSCCLMHQIISNHGI